MGYFVAYKFTGADPERLSSLIPAVCDELKKSNQEVYCTYFEEDEFQSKGYGIKEIFDHAFEQIDQMGKLFVIVDDAEKSEGTLMEVGYCLAKGHKIIVAKKKGIYTHMDKLAEMSIEYEDIDDLRKKINGVI